MVYTEYEESELKHLQQVELMILKDFIKICDEYNLEYFLYGGTAIGAVRHGGFIPWDDDLDVIMFRKDHEKFVEIMKKRNSSKYKLLNIKTEKDYFLLISKLMLKNTNFEEWWVKQVNFNVGIHMDIFVLDDIPENKFKRFLITRTCRMLDKLSTLSVIKMENYPKRVSIVANTIHYLFKTFKIPSSFIEDKCLNLMRRYENSSTSLVCDFFTVNHAQIYLKKDFLPSKKIKFENVEAKIPNNNDAILKQLYGDYMKIPPKEERYNHKTEIIDFGIY